MPSQASLKAAGVDPTSPEGTEVPLFACMQIMKEDERTGKPVLPLFIDAVEAQQATSMAQEVRARATVYVWVWALVWARDRIRVRVTM